MPEAPPQRRGQLGKAGSDRPRRARAPSFDPRVTAPTWRRPGLPARPQRPAPRESRGETRCPAPRDGPASGRGGRESSHFYWLFPRAGSQSCPRLPGSSLSSVICFLHRSFFFFFPPVLLLSLPSASVFCLLASSVFFSHLSHFFLPIFLLLVSPVLPFLCFFFFFSPSLSLSSPLLPFFLPPIKNSALDFSARSTFLGCNSFIILPFTHPVPLHYSQPGLVLGTRVIMMHLPQILSPTDYIQRSGHVTCSVPVVGKIHEGSSCKSLSFQGELKEILGFRDRL